MIILEFMGGEYYRTWKLSREEVLYHLKNWNEPNYHIPENIVSWPSQQTIYNDKIYDGADYVDTNSNGVYDPENGDYPKISGDEAVLYIVNDGRFRNNGEGNPLDSLNVDMYAMIYAFNRPESVYFNNTFFIKYKVLNKSDINYEDLKFGLYANSDYSPLESYSSNKMFIACDTLLNTFYSYPGINASLTHSPWPVKPPITMFSILNHDLDKFTQVVSVGGGYEAFDNYSAKKKYHYLNGTWDYDMFPPHPYWAADAPLDFVYASHPLDFGADNCLSNPYSFHYDPGQMLGTTGSNSLLSGESLTFEYAVQFSYQPESGYGESIDGALNSVADLIQCYQNDSIPGGGSFTGINEQMKNMEAEVFIYPNPARTTLYIQTKNTNFETYRVYSLHGQLLEESNFESQISIQHLPPGFYFLSLFDRNGKMEVTRKFVKQ